MRLLAKSLFFIIFILSLTNIFLLDSGVEAVSDGAVGKASNHVLQRRHGSHGAHGHDHEHEDEHEDLIQEQNTHSKDSTCGKVSEQDEYNLSFHIGAIFIMLFIGSAGCMLTGLSKNIPFLKPSPFLIDVGRHFGSGVIISTAFIHMLMGSISNLTSPCAPIVFQNYISFGPLIAMFSGFAIHLVEILVLSNFTSNAAQATVEPKDFGITRISESHASCPIINHHSHTILATERKVSTYLLEFGILAHSIFIGLTLGVSSGTEFTSLLIAICFHQFFEGIGLGARIAQLEFNSKIHPFLMILFFSLTTPLGMSIGVGIHSVYSPTSTTSLVVQGVFDAISAGILIYTGFADLMGKEMSLNSDFGKKPWFTKCFYLFSLYLGAAVMALIGIWA